MRPGDEVDITYEPGDYKPEDLSNAPEGDKGDYPSEAELQE